MIQNVLYLSMAALKKPPYLREARFVTASETSMIDGTVGFWHAAPLAKHDKKIEFMVLSVKFWPHGFAKFVRRSAR